MTQCKWFTGGTCTEKCTDKFCDNSPSMVHPSEFTPHVNPARTPTEHVIVDPAAGQIGRVTQDTTAGGVDLVNHPPHYLAHPSGIECIEVTRLCSFDHGNAIKYVWRYGDKNGIQDLEKAVWYLEDVISNGASWYLPNKARELLKKVLESENDPVRESVFTYLVGGHVHDAIGFLKGVVVFAKRKEQ